MGNAVFKRWFLLSVSWIAWSVLPGAPADPSGSAHAAPAVARKWQGTPPPPAQNSENWTTLLDQLVRHQMPYGSLAASARMLTILSDIKLKEAAYETIVRLIDHGFPDSLQTLFMAGDLSPSGDESFGNSYNLYKFILNKEKGMEKWAAHYLERVDREHFPKLLLYQSIQHYAQGNQKSAEELLRKILATETEQVPLALLRKAARTLARIHFDREEYEKSYDIYANFLLKLNEVSPSDWQEAAWNLYYLRRYPEVLGMIYNLESKSARELFSLEKYTLRALSYRNLCAIQSAEALVEAFDRDYGNILLGIKRGEPLNRYPELARLEITENAELRRIQQGISRLKEEQERIPDLPSSLQDLANYLYSSEIKVLGRQYEASRESALEKAAAKLLMTSEHLRFLKYDVHRERVNPNLVFRKALEPLTPQLEKVDAQGTQLRWPQHGEFWRDERGKYRGAISNQCFE